MTDLEGRALDEALARAMGWVADERRPGSSRKYRDVKWRPADRAYFYARVLPEYHASLDALLRDIEPACRERARFRFGNCSPGTTGDWEAFIEWEDDEGGIDYFYGPTAATALARAFLAVLTRGER